MRHIDSQLAPPSLSAAALLPAVAAVAGAAFPRRMQDNSPHDAYQDQAYPAEYQVCAGTQPDKTCSERLIACGCQEL